MKKWTLLLVLIAITAFTSLAALTMTYYITIYDGTGMMPSPDVYISGNYHYSVNPYQYFSGTMSYYAAAPRSYNGVAGKIYRYIDNTCNNGLSTYSVTVNYRSKSSSIQGVCYMNTSPELPFIYIPDPNILPPER